MNKRKAAGKSRPGKGTVTDKALAQSAKTAYDPKKKKKQTKENVYTWAPPV